jgi:hypothetical protein
MIEIRSKLENLNQYASELKGSAAMKKESEKVKKEAIKALSELEILLKNRDLNAIEWSEIFDAIQPYTQLDLSARDVGIIEKVQWLFMTVKSPKEQVDDLVNFVDKKRVQTMTELFHVEKTNAKKEHRVFIQSILDSKQGVDASEMREYILSSREKNPRLMLSVNDEIFILQEMLDETMKELQLDPQSEPIGGSYKIENLKQAQKLLGGNLFTFQHFVERLSGNKDQFGTVTLQPNAEDFNHQAIEKLRMQRLFRLENLHEVYQQSVGDPNREITSKFFGPTYAWYVGGAQAEWENAFELQMQNIGQRHGIKVISDLKFDSKLKSKEITEQYKVDLMLNCRPFFDSFKTQKARNILGEFNQDFVDFSKNGEVRIPRLKKTGEDINFQENLVEFRCQRSKEWKETLQDNEDSNPPLLGVPFCDDVPLKAIGLASALNAIPVMNLTYNEGGNTLMGERDSGPYVIIGLDSYDVSKSLMEKDLGREMTDDEVRMAFAIDYGVLKENVYFVEQPGDFHLDMSLAVVGKNTILVNDATLAQHEFEAHQQLWLQTAGDDRRQELDMQEEYQGLFTKMFLRLPLKYF